MMKKTTKKVICGVAALAGVMIAGVKIASNIQKSSAERIRRIRLKEKSHLRRK